MATIVEILPRKFAGRQWKMDNVPADLYANLTFFDGPAPTEAEIRAFSAEVDAMLVQEQTRRDQDEADLDAIIATERAAYITTLQNLQQRIDAWDAANNTQRMAMTKDSLIDLRADLITIGKVMRYILRKERDAAI